MKAWTSSILLFINVLRASAFVDPIEIRGRHFINTYTGQPFFIKGVDYQPGGSSGVCHDRDPLSDVETCSRDILLFQNLGINTIRVYSINPDLDHDKCMTLLAIAGIYLVLDVNSPLENQHLNRYEPWTTYNDLYLQHVFKVLQEFSHYNNTLAFFAGNEVVNDRKSAKVSPVFIKALVRDMKSYMASHGPRAVPIGYSAADDLSFRTSLPKYLQCDDGTGDSSIDFYGVNSYQWCGNQNIQTSGYDILIKDYQDYTKPIFFSEYGCNEVMPRKFQEVEAIYSEEMTGVFSGGLVYEFHQEENNYGLIEYDAEGNVHLRQDFVALKEAFSNSAVSYDSSLIEKESGGSSGSGLFKSSKVSTTSTDCEPLYDNIVTQAEVPDLQEVRSLVNTGIVGKKGRFVPISEKDLHTNYKIYDVNQKPYLEGEKIKITNHPKRGKQMSEKLKQGKSINEKKGGLFSFLFKNEGSQSPAPK